MVAEEDQGQPAEEDQPAEGKFTGEEQPEQPTGEATEEEAAEGEPTAEGESTVEEQAQQPADEVTEEEIPMEGPVEAEGDAIQPVSVVFDAMPETAVVTVWPAATEEVPAPEAIPAQADGSFALLPGEYTYTAEAEGYVSLENVPFTVTGDAQPLVLSFALEAVPLAFDQSQTVNGVIVTVRAEPGVFPEGAELSVKRVPVYKQRQADAAVEEVRDENQNVAVSYTFDIKVIDPETREELQPAEGQTVSVSFALAEVADENLETSVYHIDEGGAAEKLDVTQEDEVTASVETEGFSLYTVEFTYNTLEYVLPGDSSVAMSEILSTLGLTGAVEAVEISDTSLFSASNETGEWIVTAHRAFDTTEWMKVTINGVVYEIIVTDTAEISVTVNVTGSGSVSIGNQTATAGNPFTTSVDDGASVTLTFAPDAGNIVTGAKLSYKPSEDGTAEKDIAISGSTATFQMPNDIWNGTGVTINVTFGDGLAGGADEASAVALTDATVSNLAGGYYKVESDISFDHTLNLIGDTYLVIASGAKMTVSSSEYGINGGSYALNVLGEGTLNVTTTGSYKIAVYVSSYTQLGCSVNLTTTYIGMRCSDSFNISGGSFKTNGSDGIWPNNAVNISGGKLEASNIDANINLSYSNTDDYIKVDNYTSGKTMTIANGQTFTDGTTNYSGTITNLSPLNGKKLFPFVYMHLTKRDATCTEVGIKQECWQRSSDGKYFSDANGTNELNASDVETPMIAHNGIPHEATDTHIAYWQCSMCSKYFSEEGCTTEITEEDTKIYRTITIDGSISGLVMSNVDKAVAGTTVTLTVSHLIDASTLRVNDGSVTLTDAGNGTYTFTVPAADVTVTASTATTYSVNLPANMEIVSATNTADGSGKYISGTVVTFKASFSYTASNVYDGANTLTADDSGNYSVTVGTADIIVTATIEHSSNIDLSQAPSDFTVVDGDVLTGSTSHTVTIADGAKITLNNATITGGIVCGGTAEITLVGENAVGVASLDGTLIHKTAGIQIGGNGKTLTIKGDGSLTVAGGSASAGIGLGRTWDDNATGGSIVIEGGTVTASGGNGIGTGTVGNSKTATVGDIIIKGGTVNARLGKSYIYNGSTATIGAIKIYDTIDKVDALAITESVTYMHGDTDVTASASTYFTISENGNRRIIVPKDDTDYTITIADGIEHGTLTVAAATAKYMQTVTVTATPAFGYRFVRLVVKDADNNDVASTNNTFLMPKSNVTVSAVFEQGTHGTTEFVWGYPGPDSFVNEATIYDGVTTVNIQQTEQSYNILKYEGYTSYKFLLDNDTYDADIPYAGGTGEFYGAGNDTNFRIPDNGQTGYYDITLTDVGNGKWGVSILPTPAQMDVVPDQTYTGSAITPEPLVIAGSLSLTKDEDYEYSYTNNTNVGKATVTVTFKGDYESLGSVEKDFNITRKITIADGIEYGTVTASMVGADEGETVTLTVTPAEGYVLNHFTVTDASGESVSVSPEGSFIMPPCDVTVNATFITEWKQLQNRMAAGGNITLEKDITCVDQSEGPLEVPEGVTSTLDLNGHTVNRGLAGQDAVEGGNVISVRGTLTVNDSSTDKTGKITGGNNTIGGGGVVLDGTFTLNGGAVTGNRTNSYAGGILNYGTFNMTGGAISDNSAQDAGGVNNVGTFNFSGGEIRGNTASGNFGGGVNNNQTFNMSGSASIVGNHAATGGGVFNSGAFTLSESASITNNTANYGSGVANMGTFNMTGSAAITGNAATEAGGGLYHAGSAITLSGDIALSGNTGGDIHLLEVSPENKPVLNISGALTNADPIGVSYEVLEGTLPDTIPFTQGLNGNGNAANFKSASDDYRVRVNTSGEAELYAPTFYTVTCASCENGSVTVFGDKTRFAEYDTVTLTVAPDTGYELSTLTVKQGETDVTVKNNQFTMPAGDVTVTAAFSQHEHAFTYTATGAIITATCANSDGSCNLTDHKATLTINAPTSLTYDGTEKAATVTGAIPGVTTPEITYTKKGDASFTGTPTAAGAYTASITVEGVTASVEYTIAKAAINPTLVIQNKTYDGKEITYTTENNPGGGEVTSFSWEKKNSDNTWSSVSDTPKDSGTYRGTATIAETDNYQGATTNTVEFSISKAALTVTAKPNTITYGDAPANDGVTYSGFVNNETESVLGGTLDYDYGYTQYGNVGNSYTITPKGLTSDNYDITFATGTLTVGQKEVGLTWSSTPLTYSGSAQAPTAEATGTVNGDTVSVTVSGGQTNAGTGYTATASGLTGDKAGNYKLPSANSTTFAIGKAALTVTAKDKTITYGDAPANAGVEYSGFVNSETESVLGGTLDYDYSYTQYGDVGSYTITPKGLTSGNYEISYADGALTVEQKEVGLTWSTTPLTFTGSAQAPTATATGTVNNDAISATVTGQQTDAGSGYTATATALTGEKAGNYKLPAANTTTFAIGKAAARTIADVMLSPVYTATSVAASVAGKMPTDAGTLTYTAGTAGKTGGVTVSDFAVSSDGAVTAKLSGGATGDTVTLPVTIGSTNYADSTVNVAVTLTDKTDAGVSVAGESALSKTYGDAAFELEATVADAGTGTGVWTWTSGDEDAVSVTSGAAKSTITIKAARNAPVTITAAYVSDTTIGSKQVQLNVGRKAVTVTAGSGTKVYDGTPLTKATYSNTALATGDSMDSLVVTGSQTVYGSSDNVPSDAVIKRDGEDVTANYAITYANGTLEVTKKAVTITADGDTKVYDGTPLTKNSYDKTALASGDSVQSVTVTGSQTVFGSSENTPSAAKIVNGAGDDVTSSYDITYASGTLSVTKKPLTITADSGTKVYDGSALTKNSYTKTDLADGDSVESVTITGSQTVVGSSNNVPSAAVIKNSSNVDVTSSYAITYANGTLKVTKKALTITADSDTKVYDGSPLTKTTYTNTALATGDAIESVTMTGSQTVVGKSNNVPSTAVIRNANGEDVTGSYDISYVGGTLTVTQKALTITADGDTKPYDGTVLTKTTYTHTALAVGDSIQSVTMTGSQTNVGSCNNVPSAAKIVNSANADVTASYDIAYANGTLEVTRKAVTITAKDASKTYDGSALTQAGFTASGQAATDTHTFTVAMTGGSTITDVGTQPNVIATVDGQAVTAGKAKEIGNYTVTTGSGTLTVNRKAVTITAKDASKTYNGSALTEGGFTASALEAGDRHTFTVAMTAGSTITNAGTQPNVIATVDGTAVTAGIPTDVGNYSVTAVNGTLAVNKKDATIATGSASKAYDGTALTNAETSITGLIEGESVTLSATGSQTEVGSSRNTYSITWDNAVAGNYRVTENLGTLTVTSNTAKVVLTAASANKTYDGKALTASGVTASSLPDGFTVTATASGSQTDVGSSDNVVNDGFVIKNAAGVDKTDNFTNVAMVNGTLTVNKKPATISTGSAGKQYDGTPVTSAEASITGLVEGESVTLSATGSQIEVGESDNTYSITWDRAKAGNYSVNENLGKLTITKNSSTITLTAPSASKTYDGTALTCDGRGEKKVTASGLPDGFTVTATASGGQTNVGSSANTVNDGYVIRNADGEDRTANFTNVTKAEGTLTVNPKPLTGAAVTLSATEFTYSGASQNVTVTGVKLNGATLGAGDYTVSGDTSGTDAGTYTVTVTGQGNYKESATATWKINPKPVTITGLGAANKTYDGKTDAAATGTAAISGKVDGDDVSVKAGAAAFASPGAGTGKAVTFSGYSLTGSKAKNYVLSAQPTSVKANITAKIVGLTWANTSFTYDGKSHAPTATATGLVGSDACTVTVTGAQTNAGDHTATASALSNANYALPQNPTQSFTINPATVAVTAQAKSKTYGDADPALTYTATGLVGSDTLTGALTRASGENVGTYAIQQGTLAASGNYALTYTGANLTINKKALTVTAEAKSKTYGDADPALTYTATGLVGSDTLTGALTRASGENVGTYAIQQGTLAASGNYALTYTGANLTIGKKALTVTAEAKSKTEGEADPALTYKVTGLVGSDKLTGALTRTKGESAGSYDITIGTL
ncbi:MAG: hypothetical protein IJI71_13310, partial [Clostridia bacterium]|nr:hypothetical protein [Clostridia bacterium]